MPCFFFISKRAVGIFADLRSIGSFDFVIVGVFANEIGIRNRKKNKFFSFTEKEIYVIFSFFPQLQPNNYATLLNRN